MLGKDEESVSEQMNDVLAQVCNSQSEQSKVSNMQFFQQLMVMLHYKFVWEMWLPNG